MNWYEGDIGAAIATSKQNGLIFLVYAFDSNSAEMTELWNNESIYNLCNPNCVSIRLEAGSQPCEQFKQIFPITEYPTTYLIGTNGKALAVLAGSLGQDELVQKLDETVKSFKEASAASTSAEAEATSSNKPNLDDRVAQAREKLKMIQAKKKADEEEKERNSEMERRKMGQEIQKMKKEKDEQELKKIAEDRRREKMEDELAKKKILEKIQQDREEKQKKYAQDKVEAEKAREVERARQEQQKLVEKQAEAARNSNSARLQFRFTDGSSVVNQFTPEQKLQEARDFVEQKLREMNQSTSFSMHSSFPKREYTSADLSKTLRELGLAPSASLLIIPHQSKAAKTLSNFIPTSSSGSSGTSGSTSQSGVIAVANDVLSLLFLPFTIIFNLVMSFVRPTTNSQQASGPNRYTPATTRQPDSADSVRRRNVPGARNIRDLSNDDDDNATWNGNSTQQM